MARSIREMKKGDYVTDTSGGLHKIERIEGEIGKDWDIVTQDGRKVNCWNIAQYHKKEDL